jgi:murein DD-endopeptidase MepM/ murein hydrolase activator NlpD
LKDLKKQFKILAILIMFAALPAVFSYTQSFAQTEDEIRDSIAEKDAAIKKLEKEISSFQQQIDTLTKQKSTLSGEIKELDLTKKKLNADIQVTENKIAKTNLKIEDLGLDIGDKEISINTNESSIKLGLKTMNELEKKSLVEVILSDQDYGDIWNDLDNMITVRENLRQNIVALKETKSVLEDTRTETIKAKNELTKLKTQLADQQKIVIQNTNEKNKLLKQTQNSEANYQILLKDRIAQRDAFEKELENYEAQLQYILDPSKLPAGRVLSWPLESIFITQLFGKTSASGRLYASGTHNGVDFRAAVGTPIMAMADGKVLGVGDTDQTCQGASFGKFVFIEYTNGLSSTFGHLSLIKVREGQSVKRGQVVAYSGATGHVTGPHLHVSLYASGGVKMTTKPSSACGGRSYYLPVSPMNAYLDALKYLPPYSASQVKS